MYVCITGVKNNQDVYLKQSYRKENGKTSSLPPVREKNRKQLYNRADHRGLTFYENDTVKYC